MAKTVPGGQRSLFQLTQESLLPGVIKERHLLVGKGTKGDMAYGDGSGGWACLAIGSSYQVLMTVSGIPTWISFPQTGIATARPTSGRFAGDQFFATDTWALSIWTGSLWKSVTLA